MQQSLVELRLKSSELFHDDCYLKEFTATVASADGKFIVLDQTAFYPNQGGQPNDLGTIGNYNVVFVGRFNDQISHEVDKEGLKAGDEVKCSIGWERRHLLMRNHTATHILTKVIFDEAGAVSSGNQLGIEKSRIDFTVENTEGAHRWVEMANQIIAKNIPVKFYYITQEEAQKIKNFSRTAKNFVELRDKLRVVDIEGYDKQACGGTHVKNTSEIGKIELIKVKNKGKGHKRLYFRLN